MDTRKRRIVVDDDVDASSLTSPKRAKRNEYASTSSSVSRFPRTPGAPIASTSWSSSSPSKATRTPLTFPTATPKKTPYTPYPLQPSDSPSNPFGRKRAQRLIRSLPPPSSFSKHVALRFQLVRIPKKGTSKNAVNAMAMSHRQGGVYRIARVPLNYTFVHLRCLIAWLFNVPASYASNGLDINHPQEDGSDYLFEVKNKIDIYGPLYKPGQIKAKSGVTLVKLSNVHDPARRWKSKYGFGLDTEDDEDEEDELDEDDETEEEEDTAKDGDDQDWKWVDEEDFTIGHCFPKGLKADIGIIYHHSPTTQIHITVNKNLLPRQRGISNTPFIFGARGYVHLSPAPLPRPLFSKSILNTLSSSPAPASIHTRNREVAPLPTAFRPRASNTQVKEDIRAASKARAIVKLKSPTPPPRKAMEPAMFKKLKSPPPPPHITMDEDLTDTDADGEAEGEEDEDEDECDLHEFDATHPFFYTQGSSPSKPVPLLVDEDENDEEDNEEEGEEEERPEVIYVADSDEEEEQAQANEEEEEQSVIVISDSEEEETSYHGKASSSLPYHLREDQNRTMDTEKFNDPPYLFAKYLLEYMDPKGYQSMRAAIRKGELDEEEVFTGGVDGCEGDDPFDQDDDDDDVVEVQRKRKEKARLEKEKEQQKRRKIEQEEEDEDEDEDMQPSFHVIEDEEEEEDQEEEEETEVQLQIECDSQESSLGTGSTPSLATNASASSSLPPSSPPRASSPASQYTPYHYSGGAFSLSTGSLPDLLLSSEVILSEHYPNKKYTFTPAPPRARSKRMRIERLEKRLAKAKNGEFLRVNDENVEVKAEEEVDELAGDDGEEMVVEIVAESNANKGKPGEVWDPFGDEEEL
ncbi:hypothetical protein CPB84DRAFT_1959259 [Gymnopilus junonius]|uniref:Uncharacterized protein n=1 Tax=Gymnopilus junonius TaxID=109634 RepID=A0A9P5NWE1_GYMJU|nr:hypothetical protein CPB84DRAFT_1959259 [Gymnopilus junonius]